MYRPDEPSAAAPSEPMAPIALPGRDILSIKQAMTNCDEEAAHNPDGMYFLVVPVVPANIESATLLILPGEPFGSFSLIPSQALLSGLEDRSLNLSERQYEFSVVDTESAQIQKWTPASGASKFTQSDAIALSKFQMSFDFGNEKVIQTNQFDRQKGICYWANVFFPGNPYAPRSGRTNFAVSKSFPASAGTLNCANRVCEPDAQLVLKTRE